MKTADVVGTDATSAGDLVVNATVGHEMMSFTISDTTTHYVRLAACVANCVSAAADSLPGIH